jgi:ribose transport system permease protein
MHALEAYGLLLLMLGCIVFFSIWPTTSAIFLTEANIRILLANQAVPAIIALAALVPLVAYKIDLSVGAVAGLAAVFAASWLSGGMSIALALSLAIGLGVVVGVVNAFLVARWGVNDVIATLGVATFLHGVVVQKTGGLAVVSNIPRALTDFGTGSTLGVPNALLVLIVMAAMAFYVLEHTPLGRYLYAYGANPSAAKLVGIRSVRLLSFCMLAAATMSAVAGILYLSRAGGAAPNVGENFTLPAVAGAFLSSAAIKPGRYNVGGALVAIFLLAVVNNGLNIAGVEAYVSNYVNGAALVIGVALAAALQRKRGR